MIPVAIDLRDPVRSGIARVARSLARSLVEQARDRFEISLAGPARRIEELNIASCGDRSIRIVDWSGGRYTAASQAQWKRVRKAVGDAIWYFPHWDVPWYAVPPRYVVTVHDLALLKVPTFSAHRRWIARHWIRHAVAHASAITTGTEFTRQELRATFRNFPGPLEVIPYAVSPAFFDPIPLPPAIAARLPSGSYMLSVGNLKRHKNLAMGPRVLERMPSLHWVVVGESFPDWRDVERLARSLRVDNRIIYLGQQPDDALNGLYRGAACLFFPSRYEGFGLPLLEALACGTPVVAARVPASEETLGGLGLTCDADSPEEFASAVSATLATGRAEAARRVNHARKYSWSRSASLLANVIEAAHERAVTR